MSVTGDGAYTTPSGASPSPAGTYWWVATYSGDANNEEVASGCAAEPVEVVKATPGVADAGTGLRDGRYDVQGAKATVSGLFGATPGGWVKLEAVRQQQMRR